MMKIASMKTLLLKLSPATAENITHIIISQRPAPWRLTGLSGTRFYHGGENSTFPQHQQTSSARLRHPQTEPFNRRICLTSSRLSGVSRSPRISWHGHTKTQEYYSEQHPSMRSGLLFTTTDMADQINFGILFDIDGVLGRGSVPLPSCKRMVQLVTDKDGNQIVPIAFCTNSTGVAADKAKTLTNWLNIEIKPEQMIAAQGPLSVFKRFHDKRVLFVGQGKLHEIANELGFTNIVTIDEVKAAFPLLDIVDHGNRHYIAKNGITRSHSQGDFEPIEALVLIGEPNRWETHLQLLVDLLLTGGHPSFAPEGGFPQQHMPVLACNMDLVFMAEACMPRFGHGAFLVCLESLYKKITGSDLKYTALIGKPSEITFRYSEHVLANQAIKLGIERPLQTMYIVGDNPEVDVFGGNLYNQYIEELRKHGASAQASRQVPIDYEFKKQTISKCNTVLVGTGVYDPKIGKIEEQEFDVYHHGHRDFEANQKLRIPTMYCSDVYDAVLSILEREIGVSDQVNNNNETKEAIK